MRECMGLRSARIRLRACLYLVLIIGLLFARGVLVFQMGSEVFFPLIFTPAAPVVFMVGFSQILFPKLAFEASQLSIAAVLSLVYFGLIDMMLLIFHLSGAVYTVFSVTEIGNITGLEEGVCILISETAVSLVLFMACIKQTCKTRYLLALLGGALGIQAILLPKVLETLSYAAVTCRKGNVPDICRVETYCEVALSQSVALILLFVVVLILPEWGSSVVRYWRMSKAFQQPLTSETSQNNNVQQSVEDSVSAIERSAEVAIRSGTEADLS